MITIPVSTLAWLALAAVLALVWIYIFRIWRKGGLVLTRLGELAVKAGNDLYAVRIHCDYVGEAWRQQAAASSTASVPDPSAAMILQLMEGSNRSISDIRKNVDLGLVRITESSECLAVIARGVLDQTKLMQNDPDAPDRSADIIKGLAGIAEQVRAAGENTVAQLVENHRLVRAVLDQNKRILSEMLGSAAGATSADEDEVLSRARELMVKHPGLRMSEAIQRIEEVGGYRS